MNYGYMSGMGQDTSSAPSESQVKALQTAIRAVPGCDVGSTGVDGIFGPRTRNGLNCMIASQGADSVRAQFPFVDFLLGYSGTYRPPGTRPATVTPQSQQPPATTTRQAGVAGEIPWWGWALIAAGGVGLLAFIGLMLSGGEEDRGPYGPGFDDWDYDDRDRYYGYR